MKRRWHNPHYKRMSQKLAKYSHSRSLYFKRNKREKRRAAQGISRPALKFQRAVKSRGGTAQILKAPCVMCFVRNPGEMADFTTRLKTCMDDGAPVFVSMRNVTSLELNAITVLLAVMVEFKSRGIPFNGDFPRDPQKRASLVGSGFFRHLEGEYIPTDSYDLRGPTIYTHGKLSVDAEFSQQLIDEAAKTIWGESRRCIGVQRTFIELMHNTHDHASPARKREKHWWISAQHVESENRVAFCFVDFGVGVFESLANKPQSSSFFDAIPKIKRIFRIQQNCQILKLILNGEAHKTITGKYYRGKGLPSIYAALEKNQLSNLTMVTNDAYFDSKSSTFSKLRTGFAGTFISWELLQSNESLPN